MAVEKSTWKFEHDGLTGFYSPNKASADAVNALVVWASRGPGRSFECRDEQASSKRLVATLAMDSSDMLAGVDLDLACVVHGLRRQPVAGRRPLS
jgi:hypothetical protein